MPSYPKDIQDYIPGTFFHATAKYGASESIAKEGFSTSKSKWAKALFFTRDPEFANQHIGFDSSNAERYSRAVSSLKDGKTTPSVFPVSIANGKYFDPSDDTHLEAIKGSFKNFVNSDNNIYKLDEKSLVKHVRDQKENSWSILESREISSEIKRAGFDGFFVREKGVENLAVFDERKVKSIFETGQSISIQASRKSASSIKSKGSGNYISKAFGSLGNIFKNLK